MANREPTTEELNNVKQDTVQWAAKAHRVLNFGQEPDGTYSEVKYSGEVFNTTTTLGVGETFSSSWYSTQGFEVIEIFVKTSVPSAVRGIEIQYTRDPTAGTPTVDASRFFEFNAVDVERGFEVIRVPTNLSGFKVKYTNGNESQSNLLISAFLRTNTNVGTFNDSNVQITAKFEREVALGNINNFLQRDRFGRNPSIDTTSDPEDVWNGGGDYTGFNATGNENISTVSSSVNDVGTLVSSGTVTSNGVKTLIDSNATFVSDGVSVGDVLLNDSQGTHGVITSVDSETQVTVFDMKNTERGEFQNIVGNTYRIATTGGTGAAVIEWSNILNEDFESQTNVFTILNGTTPVTNTGDFYRLTKGFVILAGSSGQNDGIITVNQAVTTANVFAIMPAGLNRTTIAADTVPKGSIFLIESVRVSIGRSGGNAGSAQMTFRKRPFGEVFQAERVFNPTVGGPVIEDFNGGIVMKEGTDFKFRVDSVSDNGTSAVADVEYLEVKVE